MTTLSTDVKREKGGPFPLDTLCVNVFELFHDSVCLQALYFEMPYCLFKLPHKPTHASELVQFEPMIASPRTP